MQQQYNPVWVHFYNVKHNPSKCYDSYYNHFIIIDNCGKKQNKSRLCHSEVRTLKEPEGIPNFFPSVYFSTMKFIVGWDLNCL